MPPISAQRLHAHQPRLGPAHANCDLDGSQTKVRRVQGTSSWRGSCRSIRRILDRLDAATQAQDLDLPGYQFHSLKGNRKRDFAVSVSGNWRIAFRFEAGDAIDVNLEDYH